MHEKQHLKSNIHINIQWLKKTNKKEIAMRPNIQKQMRMYTIPIKTWQKSSGWNLKENTFKQGERNCKSEGGNLSLEIQQEDKVTEKT